MTTVVLDASVIVKWIFADRAEEPYSLQALQILQFIKESRLSVVQPPHWLAEVGAVVSRLEPGRAAEVIALLHAMEFEVADGIEVYRGACELAVRLRQHLFDTLYHAVALSRPDGMLLTADEQYYRRAVGAGRITLLRDYR